jgi:hypothetical protein
LDAPKQGGGFRIQFVSGNACEDQLTDGVSVHTIHRRFHVCCPKQKTGRAAIPDDPHPNLLPQGEGTAVIISSLYLKLARTFPLPMREGWSESAALTTA